MAEAIDVVVAWAAPGVEDLREVRLPAGATIADALRESALAERVGNADLAALRVGVWGRLKRHDAVLRQGDRVEVYRPLVADPNTARQHRVAKKRAAAARK